jgi:hypothetical protein
VIFTVGVDVATMVIDVDTVDVFPAVSVITADTM